MSSSNNFDFDFDFEGTDRAELLSEISALYSELSGEEQATDAATKPVSTLASKLNQETAKFGAYPDVRELAENNFTDQGRRVPYFLQDRSKQSKFYWIHFPITLDLPSNWYFNKLKCVVEFNPETTEGHLRPRVRTILPDRKFQQLLAFSDGIELRIGENFEFEAISGDLSIQAGQAQTTAKASVDAKAAGSLGLVVGPFRYSLKKAQVTHNNPGDAEVYWTIEGAKFFQENHPTLITVIEVPKAVEQVKIKAELQAYHQSKFWTAQLADLGDLIHLLSENARTFLRKGAPLMDKQEWNIPASL